MVESTLMTTLPSTVTQMFVVGALTPRACCQCLTLSLSAADHRIVDGTKELPKDSIYSSNT